MAIQWQSLCAFDKHSVQIHECLCSLFSASFTYVPQPSTTETVCEEICYGKMVLMMGWVKNSSAQRSTLPTPLFVPFHHKHKPTRPPWNSYAGEKSSQQLWRPWNVRVLCSSRCTLFLLGQWSLSMGSHYWTTQVMKVINQNVKQCTLCKSVTLALTL